MEDNQSHTKCCCSCHKQEASCSAGEKQEDQMHYLLEIADEAWSEVLKEKIKEHIIATQNDRMTELAKIVSEGNHQRWKNKMETKQGCFDFKEKLSRFFGQSKK